MKPILVRLFPAALIAFSQICAIVVGGPAMIPPAVAPAAIPPGAASAIPPDPSKRQCGPFLGPVFASPIPVGGCGPCSGPCPCAAPGAGIIGLAPPPAAPALAPVPAPAAPVPPLPAGRLIPQALPGAPCEPGVECTGGSVCSMGICLCPPELVQEGTVCVSRTIYGVVPPAPPPPPPPVPAPAPAVYAAAPPPIPAAIPAAAPPMPAAVGVAMPAFAPAPYPGAAAPVPVAGPAFAAPSPCGPYGGIRRTPAAAIPMEQQMDMDPTEQQFYMPNSFDMSSGEQGD